MPKDPARSKIEHHESVVLGNEQVARMRIGLEYTHVENHAHVGLEQQAENAVESTACLVYGWNRLIANGPAVCNQCGAPIQRGDDALVGLSDHPSQTSCLVVRRLRECALRSISRPRFSARLPLAGEAIAHFSLAVHGVRRFEMPEHDRIIASWAVVQRAV